MQTQEFTWHSSPFVQNVQNRKNHRDRKQRVVPNLEKNVEQEVEGIDTRILFGVIKTF